MIARLRGTLIEKGPSSAVVECGGVGYHVFLSDPTIAGLPDDGSEVILWIHTHAVESRIALYGFAGTRERDLFDALITVKNVGPATAIEILSGTPAPATLAQAIAAGDTTALTRIKGVGRKRADMLVVELREKCKSLLGDWDGFAGFAGASGEKTQTAARPAILQDVVSALVHLGWRAAEAERVVARLVAGPGATVESLIREALQALRAPTRS
ncbi:MAG: Holliday junction branch migration protein RuvA [Pseudomonadota bacterium]